MAQIASHGGGTLLGSGIVTVAELLSRCPTPQKVGPGSRAAVSVGSLLRREGHVGQPFDRPVHARGFEDLDPGAALLARSHRRRVTARRGAIVGGTLLAAGSVLGATLLNSSTGPSAPADEQVPSVSGSDAASSSTIGDAATAVPEAAAAPIPAPLATLGRDAHESHGRAVDDRAPASTAWMNVAFPRAVAGPAPSGPAPAAGTAEVIGQPAAAEVSVPGSSAQAQPSSADGSSAAESDGDTDGDTATSRDTRRSRTTRDADGGATGSGGGFFSTLFHRHGTSGT